MSPGILYISYDGMLEPLGQSQVVGYLERLALGRRIHLISYEKPQDWKDRERRSAMQRRLGATNICWHPLRYHKSPSAPATAYDIAAGTALGITLALHHKLTTVHARSYVAAAMALSIKRSTGASFLFDIRGLWADERVDGGLWPEGGRLYRVAKALERRFFQAADHVVTLTHASEVEIRHFDYLQGGMPPISVIPTCADLDRFTIQGSLQRNPPVLGYVGSVGTWYMLDEMLRFYQAVRSIEPGARLLIINRNEQEAVRDRANTLGVPPGVLEVTAATHSEVPRHIRRMSAGLALIKPVYSKIASAPTKVAEYFGCGIPCVGNAGVGDMVDVLERRRVGLAFRDFSVESMGSVATCLLALLDDPHLQDRCRRTAVELFSLENGVAEYNSIYHRLEARRGRVVNQ